jgi:tetratricopeptide (TPR) repeat protein
MHSLQDTSVDSSAYLPSALIRLLYIIQLFNAVLKAVQDQCHYWAGRGDCLQALRQYEDAYHDYSAAVRISPSRSVTASFLMFLGRHANRVLAMCNDDSSQY